MFMRACSFGIAIYIGGLVGLTSHSQATPIQDKGKDGSGMKFEIYQDNADEFRWRLKAANGKVMATPGQGYKAKADCKKAVERIKADVASDKLKFEVYEDNKKEHRWRLKAANGQVIGSSSEGYKTKADCEKAIDEIKKGAAQAEVEEK